MKHKTLAYIAGLLEGMEKYAHWKDGTQYVGTTGRTLDDAKCALAIELGIDLALNGQPDPLILHRNSTVCAEVGSALRARLRKLGRSAIGDPTARDDFVTPSDQASSLRRLAEAQAGTPSRADVAESKDDPIEQRGFNPADHR